MDISNWPLGKIMLLPDHAFGRRFIVSAEVRATGDETVWDISEIAFPEVCVLWQLVIRPYQCVSLAGGIRIALGDQLPTSTAMMDALEPLVPGLGIQGAEPRLISVAMMAGWLNIGMRFPIHVGGRRLVLEGSCADQKTTWASVHVLVSSVPKEVPDWMVSV